VTQLIKENLELFSFWSLYIVWKDNKQSELSDLRHL